MRKSTISALTAALPLFAFALTGCEVSFSAGDDSESSVEKEADSEDETSEEETSEDEATSNDDDLGYVDKRDVEITIADKLEEQTGERPETIECPDDLEATEGATMLCELRDGGVKLGVNVVVNEVDGDTVNFDIEVDDEAETIDEP